MEVDFESAENRRTVRKIRLKRHLKLLYLKSLSQRRFFHNFKAVFEEL